MISTPNTANPNVPVDPSCERYIVTHSGERLNNRAGTPTIHDVAINHVRTPMYGGHTRRFQSVAHHCVGAALLASKNDGRNVALWCLLHEAEVAVYGDVPGPVKIKEQREIEAAVRFRIYDRLVGQQPNQDEWGRSSTGTRWSRQPPPPCWA